MAYYQQIQYVDYCKDGERFHNGGFVKAIKDGNRQKVELHITCMEQEISGEYSIWMIPETEKNRAFSLGMLELKDGKGFYCSEREGGEEKEDVTVKIYLGQGRVLETLLKECLLPGEEALSQKETENNQEQVSTTKEEMVNQIEEMVNQTEEIANQTEEIANQTEEIAPIQETDKLEQGEEATYSVCLEDTKWEQIEKIYPKKNSFEDERNYILFALEDFLLLREDCYGLIRNSFLQHGYTNYKELVLWKGEQNRFYIGVPGIYDRRECQAAVYFGFERFECKEEPPKQGEVGYYMKRVYL